jgi:hypothetical protein
MGEMAIRNPQETLTRIPGRGITLRETDLFEAWLVALEGGEFTQLTDGRMGDGESGRCVMGVAETILRRAGIPMVDYGCGVVAADWQALDPHGAMNRAAALLGYPVLSMANDAGCSFAELALALRAARMEVERG